jgi:trans-aconitate 2-methyltransferase
MDWNSEQYLMFKAERTQPAVDLANRITTVHPRKNIGYRLRPR